MTHSWWVCIAVALYPPCILRISRFGGGFPFSDQHVIAFDFDIETVDLGSWIVFPRSVLDAEPPGVPGTGDGILFEVSLGQRRSHVGTEIIDRMPRVALAKNGHHPAINRHRAALTILEIGDFSDNFIFAHELFSLQLSTNQTLPLRILTPVSHTLALESSLPTSPEFETTDL
jgi:hypothetical protein